MIRRHHTNNETGDTFMKVTIRGRWMLVPVAIAATFAGLIAGQVGIGASAAAATPQVAQAEGQPADGQLGQTAVQMLDKIVAGDDNGVASNFDADMKQRLAPEQLGQAWTAYQAQFGSFQSHGTPEILTRGQLTVVNVPLQMAKSAGQFRLTYSGDRRIAGLYFLRPGVPVPGS